VGNHSRRTVFAVRQSVAALVVLATVTGLVFLGHAVFDRHADAATNDIAHQSPVTVATTPGSSPAGASATAAAAAHAAEAEESHSELTVSDATTQLTALDAGQPAGAVSVSATNLTTGATFSWGATSGMVTASVIKLDTLETMLLQHQQAGTALSSYEQSEATLMIENSDNDAADALWADVGSDPAVTAANQTFGLASTVVGTDDYWGLTTTSAADQVTLLKQLVGQSSLDAASQSYALGLMRSVESDEAWGVSAVADAGTSTALKNGWLAVSDDDNLWTVNSVGLVTVHGQQLALAIMTQHQSSENISFVQQLAAATVTAVT
jgi:beta-lactamase class A